MHIISRDVLRMHVAEIYAYFLVLKELCIMIKQVRDERDYLLDSSLISTTFLQIENTKKLYNMKVVYCNDYIQLYTFNNDKFYKIWWLCCFMPI